MAASKFEEKVERTYERVEPVGDPLKDPRDRTREVIAVWLLGLLCVVVGLAFTAYFLDYDAVPPDKRFNNLKSLLDVLIGPIITLLSSAIGFYFGSRTAETRVPRTPDQSGGSGASKTGGDTDRAGN